MANDIKTTSHDAAPSNEEIAARAYELYIRSGRVEGHDLENWLQAETQLREKNGPGTPQPSSAPVKPVPPMFSKENSAKSPVSGTSDAAKKPTSSGSQNGSTGTQNRGNSKALSKK